MASFFGLISTARLFSKDADIIAEALINGKLCEGKALVDQFKRILKFQGADPLLPLGQFEDFFGSELNVVATDLTSRLPRLLNASTAPNLPVAYAVAMSACFPIVFPAIEWKPEWGLYDGKDLSGHLFCDGGIVQNFPIRYYLSNEPEVIRLRGGKLFDPKKTLFLDADSTFAPAMSPQE